MGLFSSRKKFKNAATAPMTETKSQELPEEEQPTKFDAINEQAQVIEREIDSSSETPSNASVEEVSHEVISSSEEVVDSNEQTTGAEEDEEVGYRIHQRYAGYRMLSHPCDHYRIHHADHD